MGIRIAITGANRGIGLQLVKQALLRGHQVFAGARRPGEASNLYQLKYSAEGALSILELDVESEQSIAQFREGIGSTPLDLLINNAGVYLPNDDKAASVSLDAITKTLNVNTLGPIRLTQALLPLLRKSSTPKIANITSQMGSIADNKSGGSVAYRMSKTALNMYVKTLAVDEPSVTVLTLHPGWVKTEMGGENAPLSPEASAEGLLNLMLAATNKDSGRFYNYAGQELPW